MKKPHKHAAIIHAFADGAKIEYRINPQDPWQSVDRPGFIDGYEYRIAVPTTAKSSLKHSDMTRIYNTAMEKTNVVADALEAVAEAAINRYIEETAPKT